MEGGNRFMSSIDQRVVDMRFNNQQFESGVRTSTRSLDKLKSALNLDGAAKSLNALDKAGKSFSLNGISSGVESISQRFSTMGIVGMTVLQNLTNAAITASVNFAKALIIQPILDGFDEYEVKMNAIQTIMSNTSSKGTTLTQVNDALAELNTYADQTIYNFAQMTDNVGKFTSAGVGLQDSVTMVKGLSNVAAGAGTNAERMAGATFQMTQAMQSGMVIWEDWKSLSMANMGGENLQKEMQTMADSMGIVRDKTKSFKDSLESGWLTAEVFTKVMKKMAADPALLEAATNVTTFTKLVNTMAEAVGSGWASTWEQVIGSKDQSTKFFTAISNGFGSVVGASANARNATLEFWNANGGREAVIRGLANVLMALANVIKPVEQAFSAIFPPLTLNQLLYLSTLFRDLTARMIISESTMTNIRKTFQGLFSVLDIVRLVFAQLLSAVGLSTGIFSLLGKGILYVTGSVGEFITAIRNIIKTLGAFTTQGFDAITELFRTTFNAKFSSIINKMSSGFNFMGINMESLGKSSELVKYVLNGMTIAFNNLISTLKTLNWMLIPVRDTFNGFMTSLTGYKNKTEVVTDGNNNVVTSMGELSDAAKKATGDSTSVWDLALASLQKLWLKMAPFKDWVVNGFTSMMTAIKDNIQGLTFEEVFHTIQGLIASGFILTLRNFIANLNKFMPKVMKSAAEALDAVGSSLKTWQNSLRAKILLDLAIAVGILAASIYVLSGIDPVKLSSSLKAVAILFGETTVAMIIMAKALSGSTLTGMFQLGIALLGLSGAVLILAKAMVVLTALDWNQAEIGFESDQ